jgi:2-polyprenyl-3-methyl-5-hydroxy-6-metoxy-1,4-benzoquinol methylase
MFGQNIWDHYAGWYEKLWVQRLVLKPSRNLIINTLKELPPANRILDAGCGIGELCNDLINEFSTTIIDGIDPSLKMIERAGQLFAHSNIRFICGNVELVLQDEMYDYVVSTHAFPYIKNKQLFLNKLMSHLNPNGRIFLIFANTNNLYDAIWLNIVKLTTSEARYLSVDQTKQLLIETGFKPGKIQRINSRFFVPSVYLIEGIKP